MTIETVTIITPFLNALLGVAAELARSGDSARALKLKGAHDGIKQTLCPHDGGTTEALFMSGTSSFCRRCGLEVPQSLKEL